MRARSACAWFVLTLPLTAVGCSASQCDPSQADLFTGIGCAVGNGYSERHQEQVAQLQSADTGLTQAQIRHQNALNEEAAAQANLSQRRAEMLRLDNKTAELRARVQAAEATHAADSTELQKLNDELAALRRLQATNTGVPSAAQLAAIQARQAKLADILAAMGQ
jgi:hypothetical protein